MGENEGIFMLHAYPELQKTTQVTNDGLCFGGREERREGREDGTVSYGRYSFNACH